ncbi:hypothetical protein OSB04_007079 [Centaurea solstitialis]|uniref:Aminotransferase-like plant mobile domain-containing protein n=1 Tax=Centaurea solstitialis TaxID=347529 RepID=A0AA38WSD7_9ASTR|nr:hypothetical protein OSB04_007079 [Centaurea solstitialis]
MENMRIRPGPLNNELLFLETSHRAYKMFYGEGNAEEVLDVRRGDQGLWRKIKVNDIPNPVMNYIRRAGFEGMINCGFKPLDHALITELVERWRPETHTFHLPIGEVTVTLQDVQLIWGLRIDGVVVTGRERKWSDTDKIGTCYRLLGIETEPGHFRGAQLKMPFLRTALDTPFSDNPTNEQCMQRARVYILLLLGGSIFPDTSYNSVHLNLLLLLEDFDRCGGLSWGSAALACLYRNVCKAACKEKIIAGPMMLLQLWAWSKIRATAPKYECQNPGTPYGVRWNNSLHFDSVPKHAVSGLHSLTRRGATSKDWVAKLAPQINHWRNRTQHYVNGQITMKPTTENGYMNWYLQRTVIHIVQPMPNNENAYRYQNYGGTVELLMEGLGQAHEGLSQVNENHPDYQHLHGLYETTGHYLGFTYGENRLQGYGPHVIPVGDFAPVNANLVERVRRQPRVQRRRHEDEAGPSNQDERAPSHHDDEAGPSYQGERAPSHHDDEAGPSSMQLTPGLFNDGPPEPSGQYEYMSPIPHLNPF